MDQSKKILVVEDDRLTSYLIITLLKRMGHHVFEPVTTGEMAIERAVLHKPDIILMDIWLAGEINGYDAATVILSSLDTSIIFLSGQSDSELVIQSKKVNYFAFLKKPLVADELENILKLGRD